MGPEKVKELLKRYVETLNDLNNDTMYDSTTITFNGDRIPGIKCVTGFEDTIDFFFVNGNSTIVPRFLIIKGEERVNEIKKLFSTDELKTIILNIHHIGDIGDKIQRMSPEKPYEKGQIGDPFYRMFDEITTGSTQSEGDKEDN